MNKTTEQLHQMIVELPIEDRMIIVQTALQHLAQQRGVGWAAFLFELDADVKSRPLDEQITNLRVLVDATALAYGTTQRVILDKIDGRLFSDKEQDVKSVVITGMLKDINIDDTVEILRKALEKIAERNHTTPATLLGLINSGLHREWGRQYEQRRKEHNNNAS